MSEETIYQRLEKNGVSRRDFLKLCGTLVGAMGLAAPPLEGSGLPGHLRAEDKTIRKVARALESKARIPVIWLEFQDCAGCSEALTRSQSPTLIDLVLNTISVEYHETLTAAAGHQTEENKQSIMKQYAGQYVLVVEGSIPMALGGAYCTIGGRSAIDILEEAAAGAAAIISTGNCAAFGGLPKANPNPTDAKGVWELITDKPVVNIPGCPAIPEVFTGTLAHFVIFGGLPELDDLNRPVTFYGKTIHDRCLRRPFYEAGKFANTFDDEGAKQGWCLYKLGCKGPTTHNACATIKWDAGLSFPVQSGHPCLGCSEPDFWDGGGFYQGQSAPLNRPAATAVGAAIGAGAVVGAAMAANNSAQKKRAAQASEE
ncbi:MAG: hydrogenase small subunit [Chloroflexi bacterium]|jgi:hydrogenase small subunit|nr:hydrogenase small subunit [Chloroflexota bacterium]